MHPFNTVLEFVVGNMSLTDIQRMENLVSNIGLQDVSQFLTTSLLLLSSSNQSVKLLLLHQVPEGRQLTAHLKGLVHHGHVARVIQHCQGHIRQLTGHLPLVMVLMIIMVVMITMVDGEDINNNSHDDA